MGAKKGSEVDLSMRTGTAFLLAEAVDRTIDVANHGVLAAHRCAAEATLTCLHDLAASRHEVMFNGMILVICYSAIIRFRRK